MKTAQILLLLAVAYTIVPISLSAQGSPEKAVRALLDAQVQSWNAGNIEEFMQGYWQSDSLRFASGGSVKYGWKTTLERYRKGYPDKAAMGKLTFSNLETTVLSADAVVVFGKWELMREQDKTEKDRPHGLFTLTFRKTPQGWKIIHDHTSSGN
ncbi:MAG: nuclear transport factor 2 family protein [Ignavibacteria bacterium]|nr:nuclear transport factor 2 family protein [Ignavibacteria bacterium]